MTADVKRRVGVFRNVFLNYSETFIHEELRHHQRYESSVFARIWRNHERFPGHRVHYIEKEPEERHPIASLWYGVTGRNRHFSELIESEKIDISTVQRF